VPAVAIPITEGVDVSGWIRIAIAAPGRVIVRVAVTVAAVPAVGGIRVPTVIRVILGLGRRDRAGQGEDPGGSERQGEDWAPEPTGYARSRHGGLHSAEGDAILLYGGGEFLSLSARVFAPKF